jgi:DNA-binding Lrp family transcriptional regulator
MTIALKQFSIRKLREPTENKVDDDIKWICNSLGFVTKRDQDNTAFEILKALIKAAKYSKGLTSEELSRMVEPTIGSVIYHLKKLTKSGLVVKIGSAYQLKMNSLLATIDDIHKEINLTLEDIKKISTEIDNKVGLEHR